MSMNNCLDIKVSGQCMKGKDCKNCNPEVEDINLNLNAKSFIPKSKQRLNEQIQETTEQLQKLSFNLNAKEYVPKFINQEDENEEIEDDDEELDIIVNDIINNDMMEELEEEESDDEKWFPSYKDCECCKGFVYKCQGSACVNMGTCYCKVKDECDNDDY